MHMPRSFHGIRIALLCGLASACTAPVPPFPTDFESRAIHDKFEYEGPLHGFRSVRAEALPEVMGREGRYRAVLRENPDNRTLHFNENQGRLDAFPIRFPFEAIARNVGIGTPEDSQQAPSTDRHAFIFAGLQVHAPDLEVAESAHLVVGHRGSVQLTVEGKHTRGGISTVTDEGAGAAPLGRADLRIVGRADGSLRAYWQPPNPQPGVQADDWRAYGGDGRLPGRSPRLSGWGWVGLITYAQGESGLPFVGTADTFELRPLEPDDEIAR
jgi:hypothetical protein